MEVNAPTGRHQGSALHHLPVGTGRQAGDFPEKPRKIKRVRPAHGHRYLVDPQFGGVEQLAGALDF